MLFSGEKSDRRILNYLLCWLCGCVWISVWQSAGIERKIFFESGKTLEQQKKRGSRFYNGAIFHAIELGRGSKACNVRKACRKRRCWLRSHLLCMSSTREERKCHCLRTTNGRKMGRKIKTKFSLYAINIHLRLKLPLLSFSENNLSTVIFFH